MNNPETHGSVQQLARDGEALPAVALPTEGSAPLGVEALTELRGHIRRSLRQARTGMDETQGQLPSDIFDELCDAICALDELEATIGLALQSRASIASDKSERRQTES